ncbi:neurogenic locus notch-like protein [Trema orientale]|uniref:Neurogenic locus notch-like protein n=1 Tax=Trema orientale TaxID=63057 RepID=A0A2P5ENT1_TREOI|nr:neurogenic locus notch-like protein [Trema orientale]
MASSTSLVFVAMVLVSLTTTAFGLEWDDIAPSIAEEICKEVECGKGNCKADGSFPLGFTCECDAGWKRTRDQDLEDDLHFLPCVIPNCTLNYGSCQPAPPPVPEKEIPRNLSAFDPCYWAYCGEGTCTKNRTHTHTCQCNPGFFNLLNVSAFPCYSECTLGSDCSRLGIKVANSTSGGDDGNNNNNQATSYLPGKFQWLIISMVSFGLVLWK